MLDPQDPVQNMFLDLTGSPTDIAGKAGELLSDLRHRIQDVPGMTFARERDYYVVTKPGGHAANVFNQEGVIKVRPRNHPRPDLTTARIEFDRAKGAFVGLDVDHNIAPTPGRPLPRRDAAQVVAEAIAEAIRYDQFGSPKP